MLVVSLANIFSHSEACLFVLLSVSFAVRKFLDLNSSHLFSFVFIFTTLRLGSKKLIAAIYVKKCTAHVFL